MLTLLHSSNGAGAALKRLFVRSQRPSPKPAVCPRHARPHRGGPAPSSFSFHADFRAASPTYNAREVLLVTLSPQKSHPLGSQQKCFWCVVVSVRTPSMCTETRQRGAEFETGSALQSNCCGQGMDIIYSRCSVLCFSAENADVSKTGKAGKSANVAI